MKKTALEWLINEILTEVDKYDDEGNIIGIDYWNSYISCTSLLEYVNIAREIEIKQKESEKDDILKHLNTLLFMPSSKLDLYVDENGLVTKKWFEQFKK